MSRRQSWSVAVGLTQKTFSKKEKLGRHKGEKETSKQNGCLDTEEEEEVERRRLKARVNSHIQTHTHTRTHTHTHTHKGTPAPFKRPSVA